MITLLTLNAAAPCQESEGEPVRAMGTPSYGQRSLWFLQHLAPQGGAYNIAAAARVRTPIDAGALERAFQALVDRHAALRTTFPAIDGAPCRRVAGRQSFSLVCMDAGGWSEQALRARLAEEAWRPFDLERGPLLRATLLMGGPGGPVLLLAVHHIVADFWSLAILVRELPLLYREAAGAGPAQLSSPGMDYGEHVRMEREALGDGRGEALLAYWRETLAGLPALELPLDRPRPAVQTDRGDSRRLRLPGELAAALRARSRKQHATLFMTLAAAFQVLLGRQSGQEDFALGAPRAGRRASDFAGTVGYFVNPMVLRGDLTGDPTFAELLERTKTMVLAAFEHGDIPLPFLVEQLHVERDPGRTPLFQVSFVMQKETRGVEGLTAFALGEEGVLVGPEDFRLEALSLPRPPAPFELMLHAVERQGSLSLALQFNTDLFDTATAVHLLDRFALLLRSVVESPELALSALPLLSAAERHQLLHAWNDTAEAGPEATLYDLFAAQAERTPEAVAVVSDEERLTYRELAVRAQALARHLVSLGVGPEVVVGVAAERSVELVAGLLGVLGAGGAWLPLEPDLPRQRLAMILKDAAPAVVLTRRAYADTLPLDAVPGLRLAWLDEVSGLQAGAAQRLPRAAADNAAYVIYTSGSTGRPKGVVNSHRGIVNRLLWMQEACGLDAGDRFLQKTPFGFDVSVPEFFAPLILGARLVVARPDAHRDSAYLARLVEQEGVTTIHFVPSMLPFFLAEDGVVARCRSLRRVLVSGEALPWEVEQRCLATLPVPLYNLYGPTEAAVEVTAWSCRPAERPRPGENPRPVPIGRPVRNTQIHVVGRRLEPVPPGAVGELAIGGVQVARGYRGRPDLTAERFVPDPFGPPLGPKGARLYRTGDLCRHLPGGEIEYLGRLDDQVKIRGFRIEPREIEIALAAQPQVREAAVVVRQDGTGERSLLACVVPAVADAGAGTAAELRAALDARLPSHMVPAFAFGRALDRLPNGKLDRRSLARWSPVAEARRTLEAPEAPRTPLEELLAGLFAEVLGVDRLGVEESFFEHGGHSLAAMRLIARIREALGTELPLHRVFETPTVAALARAIAGEARSDVRSDAPPLVPVSRATPRATPLPLSFAQQRLWFLHQLEPASPVYNMPAALYLPGRLDRAVLAAALGEAVRRHESLRTRFVAVEGEPVQVVDPPAPVPVPEIDLAGLPAARRLEEARRLAREEALRPFDLGDPEGGPLLRTVLVRLGEAEQLLLLTMHHVISDGWSLRVLARELAALYEAGLERRPSPLPELAIQYGDYAVWQRGWLRGEVLEAELAHWRARLAGAPPVLDLPLDRPRPAVMSSRGASRALALPPALLPLLQALARRQGVTLFMAVLAAFQALLARISHTDDVSVGSPVAGRGQLRTEGLIGFFVNTLVLRTDLSGAPTFAELLARVRETSLAAYAHQDLPFEKLVEELHPQRDLSYAPLYQVSFVLDSDPLPALRLGDVEASLWPQETEIEKFDLSLTLGVGAEGLSGAIGFRSDLFDGATIERLAGSFARLLAGAVAAPPLFLQHRLPELPLLSEEEVEQLLRIGDGGGESYPREAALYDLFAEQAALSPDAVALAGPGTVLTYGELARQATRWAHRLRALGVGPEVRVALCFDRNPARVVATLAVLAAGGAYVPLDPAYPRERLAFLLRNSAAAVLVTQERWLPLLSEISSELLSELPDREAAVLCLDGTAAGEEEGREAALPAVAATGLAYVMYTSGSTGEPKGVAVTHRGVVRLVRGTGYARFGPGETWLQYAPYTFDASTLELWGALLHGSRLVIPPPGVLTAAELGEVVKREGVTTLWLTTGLFRQMVEENPEALSGVRQLLTGGDVMPVAHARRVLAELPETRLVNFYGPTENTTFTSFYPVRAAAELDPSVPVGRPIAHTWVAVLDRDQVPVPPGVAGELYTGGDGLARGYLDHPDRTAERFLPDPSGREAGGRLYKTGDLVRWRRSGDLEFLGRIDAQVKVRGFRVEPGEIETALTAHPRLSSAVVLAEREEAGGHRLVAYVVAAPAAPAAATAAIAPEPSELRDFLRQRLPEFMVPSAWVSLPALPLTANSKVDRKALTLLKPDRPRSTGGAPRTPAEERIAGIFSELLGAEVLGVEPVGPEADFFDLGGHSLLATRLVSRVRAVFGVELPLQAVFETPTVEGLAARIGCSPGPPLNPIVRMPREQPLALSFAQQRLWFLERIEPGAAYLHLPAALDCAGRLDPAALAGSLGEILRRHEGLRTRFVLSGRQPLQIPLPPAELAAVPLVPCIDLSALPATAQEGEVSRRTAAEAARPFDLARGPLLHAVLLRRGPESHRLLLTVHHIAADAWSLGLLIRELGELYAARVEARPSPLPELSVCYADYAVWQRERLRGDRLEELLRYWRERLTPRPPALELPTDRPRPPVRSPRGARRPVRFDAAAVDAMRRLCGPTGATLFMAVLAVFQAVLARHAGQDDVAVGTAVADRPDPALEGVIGLFLNLLVLRGDLSGDPTFRTLLLRVRETALGALAHAELPFEQLVDALQPERDLSRGPLFQVLFTLRSEPLPELALPGLALRPADTFPGAVQFDLSLLLEESRNGGIDGWIEHSSDLFDGTTVERLALHCSHLLASAAADPDRRLSDLPLLSEAERAELLVQWNDTRTAVPGRAPIHELFHAQVERTPDRIAAVDAEAELTYRELAERASRLARRLVESGVRPGDRVGVCVERSVSMLCSILGVLKAGAAYVPLDPAYPQARLAAMLEDSGAAALVASAAAGASLRHPRTLSPEAPEESSAPLPWVPAVSPAYILYTSGSTGIPKGVVVTHANACNLFMAMDAELRPVFRSQTPGVWLAVTSICFDISVVELLWTLTRGFKVVIHDGPDVAEQIARHGVSHLQCTPSMAGMLAAIPERLRSLAPLSHLLLGGEALPGPLADRLAATVAGEVRNLYGPTETTVYSLGQRIERGEEKPLIGRPLSNTEAYLLDASLRPVPLGACGEVFLGGDGVAMGYWRRPDLTAERFLPDPLGSRPGGRLYRTGDLARYRQDGRVDYLGRSDHQVKVRGVRMELGEIEEALRAHPAVAETVAAVRDDGPGGRQLIAWLVPVAGAPAGGPSASELRRFLGERLPEAMIPSAFVPLAALPLTRNGKVDRKALPAPDTGRLRLDSAYAPPRTPDEKTLAAIWQEVLGHDRIGVNDNFFELGGSSLLLVEIEARLRGAFHREIPIVEMFRHPTIRSLAEA
ncbi:MAG TPA: amino acid adenylation domain-containing protein, partial [Thermoanaerobaculia bacterium]|nr:amino acid adenylation domain-containing protein [Thermoanaerobaculia bacterium]